MQYISNIKTFEQFLLRFNRIQMLVELSLKRKGMKPSTARLAQSVERKALNLVVVGSSPTVGDIKFFFMPLKL